MDYDGPGFAVVGWEPLNQRARMKEPSRRFCRRLTAARMMWGADLGQTMLDYNYYAGLGIVGEVLPQMKNMVNLHGTARDPQGLPAAQGVSVMHPAHHTWPRNRGLRYSSSVPVKSQSPL